MDPTGAGSLCRIQQFPINPLEVLGSEQSGTAPWLREFVKKGMCVLMGYWSEEKLGVFSGKIILKNRTSDASQMELNSDLSGAYKGLFLAWSASLSRVWRKPEKEKMGPYSS